MTIENINETDDNNLWPSIDIKSWQETPAINGRLATEIDAKNNLAIYYIENGGIDHSPYNILLPKLAYLLNSETQEVNLVVVIQIETTAKDTVAGYRNIEGGNGACMLNELKFLDESEIKKLVNP